MNFFDQLNLKDDEISNLNQEINNLLEKNKDNESDYLKIIKEKDLEINDLNMKINNLDIHLQKYENDLVVINNNFEKNILECEKEIHIRDNEIIRLRNKHENEKKAVMIKKFFKNSFLLLISNII